MLIFNTMLIYYSFNNSYLLVTLESVLDLKTHGFQGIFCNIIIFGGAYRYCRATVVQSRLVSILH